MSESVTQQQLVELLQNNRDYKYLWQIIKTTQDNSAIPFFEKNQWNLFDTKNFVIHFLGDFEDYIKDRSISYLLQVSYLYVCAIKIKDKFEWQLGKFFGKDDYILAKVYSTGTWPILIFKQKSDSKISCDFEIFMPDYNEIQWYTKEWEMPMLERTVEIFSLSNSRVVIPEIKIKDLTKTKIDEIVDSICA